MFELDRQGTRQGYSLVLGSAFLVNVVEAPIGDPVAAQASRTLSNWAKSDGVSAY